MKNQFILILSIIFTLQCCKKRDYCNNSLEFVGIYENTYEKNAKDILKINPDGTFIQIYTKGKVVKKNKGKWKLFKEHCSVKFDTLQLMHELPKQFDSLYPTTGLFRNNNILFYEDFPDEYDYKRIKN